METRTLLLKVEAPARYLQRINTALRVTQAELLKLGIGGDATSPEERLLVAIFGRQDDGSKILQQIASQALASCVFSADGEPINPQFRFASGDPYEVSLIWDQDGRQHAATLDLKNKQASRRVTATVA